MRFGLAFVLLLSFLLLSPESSLAQSTSPQPGTEPLPGSTHVSPPPGYVPRGGYELEEANRRSRVVRNALIGTSVGFAVGAILAGVGASQCDWIEYSDGRDDELNCNKAGDVLLPLGGTFMGLGAIGMITTGIMLGVRNKQKREIERDMRNRYGGRFRWDLSSGRFVF